MAIDQYCNLGRTGLKVSRLCFGVMNFGVEADFFGYEDWLVDKALGGRLLDAYVGAGGNFIDTANSYNAGQSEQVLGELVQERGIRDSLVISTKYNCNMGRGVNSGGNGRKNIMSAIEGSLARLQTDYIDVYTMHFWDTMTSAEEVLRTMDDLVSAGKIRHYALSNVPAWYAGLMQGLAYARGMEKCAALQLEYSLVERNLEREFVDLAIDQGMGIVAWSPLCMGLLAGRYQRDDEAEVGAVGDGRLTAVGITNNDSMDGRFKEQSWAVVAELEKIAEEVERTMAQVALNWAANRPGIASLIFGASTVDEIEENVQALDFSLTDEQHQRLCDVSQLPLQQPYTMFTKKQVHEVAYFAQEVRDKPESFYKR